MLLHQVHSPQDSVGAHAPRLSWKHVEWNRITDLSLCIVGYHPQRISLAPHLRLTRLLLFKSVPHLEHSLSSFVVMFCLSTFLIVLSSCYEFHFMQYLSQICETSVLFTFDSIRIVQSSPLHST